MSWTPRAAESILLCLAEGWGLRASSSPAHPPEDATEPRGLGQSIPGLGASEVLGFSASCPLHKCNFPECQRKALQITHCV